jgi:hypothetical protein
MLIEPDMDGETAALDAALAEALKARLDAGGRAGPDAEALALRGLLDHTDTVDQAALLKAVWGRIAADTGPVLFAAGPTAHLLAADRFGLPVRTSADAEAALVEAGRGARALIDLDGPRLAASGFLAQGLVSAGGLKLFMLAGYVQPEDGRLIDAPGSLKGVIGAAPVF